MEPRGIEPLTSLPQGESEQQDATTAAPALAQTLAREMQIDPDLARVVSAWPDLPEAIRRAVLALVGTLDESATKDGSKTKSGKPR
jgi:hypothetical protein